MGIREIMLKLDYPTRQLNAYDIPLYGSPINSAIDYITTFSSRPVNIR